jgi:chromosome segregation ATPase
MDAIGRNTRLLRFEFGGYSTQRLSAATTRIRECLKRNARALELRLADKQTDTKQPQQGSSISSAPLSPASSPSAATSPIHKEAKIITSGGVSSSAVAAVAPPLLRIRRARDELERELAMYERKWRDAQISSDGWQSKYTTENGIPTYTTVLHIARISLLPIHFAVDIAHALNETKSKEAALLDRDQWQSKYNTSADNELKSRQEIERLTIAHAQAQRDAERRITDLTDSLTVANKHVEDTNEMLTKTAGDHGTMIEEWKAQSEKERCDLGDIINGLKTKVREHEDNATRAAADSEQKASEAATSLATQVASLRHEQERGVALTDEKRRLVEQVQELTSKTDADSKSMTRLEAILSKQSKQLASWSEREANWNDERSKRDSAIMDMSATVTTLRTQLSECQSQLDASVNVVNDKQRELVAANNRITELTNDGVEQVAKLSEERSIAVTRAADERESLIREQLTLEKQQVLDEVHQRERVLHAKLEALQLQMEAEGKQSIDDAKAREVEWQSRIRDLESKYTNSEASWSEEKKQLTTENTDSMARIKLMETQLSQVTHANENRLIELETQMSTLHQKLDTSTEALTSSQTAVATAKTTIEALQVNLEQNRQQTVTLEAALADAMVQRASIIRQHTTAFEQLTTQMKEESNVTIATSVREATEATEAKLRSEHDAMVTALRNDLVVAQRVIGEEKARAAEAASNTSEVTRVTEQLTNERVASQKRIDQLTSELVTCEAKVTAALAAATASAEASSHSLGHQLRDLQRRLVEREAQVATMTIEAAKRTTELAAAIDDRDRLTAAILTSASSTTT